MSDQLERALAEATALVVAARAALDRDEVPDLAPLSRAVARVQELAAAASTEALGVSHLKFLALSAELQSLVEACGGSLARTRNTIEGLDVARQASDAYARTGRGEG